MTTWLQRAQQAKTEHYNRPKANQNRQIVYGGGEQMDDGKHESDV
jgi:hypothetical protein